MRILLALLLGATLMVYTGCDAGGTTRVRFVNRSNHVVNVRPDGDLFWEAFTLAPGEKQEIKAEKVFFTYSPQSLVQFEQESDGDIIFFNNNVERADGG